MFTGELFAGNPAAVCLLDKARSEYWMQDVASEMNLSETSFLVGRDLSIPIYQVDAFTGEMFAGNPAAVCLLGEARAESWMQDVASEMNLSETSFLVRRDDGYDLRWFTPATEANSVTHDTEFASEPSGDWKILRHRGLRRSPLVDRHLAALALVG